jgi:ATP-binding protein involved in chromosome partitioning
MLDRESILEVLRPVQDPELQKSLVELNMIRNVKVDGSKVSFTLVLTTPACPLREFIVEDCQTAVKKLPGVETVSYCRNPSTKVFTRSSICTRNQKYYCYLQW